MRLRLLHTKIFRLLTIAMLVALGATFLFPALASAHVSASGSGALTGFYTGQIDAPTLFNLVMVTLVEIGSVFWVGAQLWLNFVLQTSSEKHRVEQGINQETHARFERRFSLPTLIVILLANIGVLIGQALILTGGDWGRSLSAASLLGLATSARFGVFWLIGEGVLILAIAITLYLRLSSQHSRLADMLLPLLNLLLGLVLFISITMTANSVSANNDILTLTIVLNWVRLLATALWIGGIFYMVAIYLPTLKRHALADEARSLTTVLPYFTPLAIAGIILTIISVLFVTALNQVTLNQLTGSAYGRAFVVELGLLLVLAICSILQLFLYSPRIGKEYRKYAYAARRFAAPESPTRIEVETYQNASQARSSGAERTTTTGTDQPPEPPTQQVRLREKRLTGKIHTLLSLLRWEPVLGIAILVTIGLTNVFAGTISAAPVTTQKQTGGKTTPFTSTVHTTDSKFTAMLEVNPNRFGANVFTVTVTDSSTGKIDTGVSVTISTTMLDMDMGTDTVSLLPDGKGHFSGSGDLSMSGNWQIGIQIRTPDHTLHEATVNIVTPF
jgi:copper transport protein